MRTCRWPHPFGELLLARRFGLRFGFRASGPALEPRPERLRTSGPVFAAPAFQGCDARDPVHGHDLRLGQTVLDVVARRGDLRLPVVASAAAASHDRLLAAGPVQHDPVFRGLSGHGKPSGERVPAGSGLDGFQRLTPEPVVVTSPSILTHTKEPHLRSSNLNFFSPTIGVRFCSGFVWEYVLFTSSSPAWTPAICSGRAANGQVRASIFEDIKATAICRMPMATRMPSFPGFKWLMIRR